MDILSPLEDNRLEAMHQQAQCRKHSGRTGTYDHHRLGSRHILILLKDISGHNFIRLIYLYPVTVEDVVARIDRTAHYPVSDLLLHLRRHAQGLHGSCKYLIGRQFLTKLAGNFYFFHNSSDNTLKFGKTADRSHIKRRTLAVHVMEPSGNGDHGSIVGGELEFR